MRNPTVYIETSIPSFYHEMRQEPAMQARREWTRQWWSRAHGSYELFTSEAVLDELGRGEYPTKPDCLSLVQSLPVLPIDAATADIVAAYLRHRLMPRDPAGDALHLALASQHKCDFLLTWNCMHLANANKFGHIRRVNTMLGLFVPTLTTPLELLGGTDEDAE
jgi:predicted nucleic acid-binding protein